MINMFSWIRKKQILNFHQQNQSQLILYLLRQKVMGSCFKSNKQKYIDNIKKNVQEERPAPEPPKVKTGHIEIVLKTKEYDNKSAERNKQSTKQNLPDQKKLERPPQQLKTYQIDKDNIDKMIKQASQQRNQREAINQFSQIKSYIQSTQDKNFIYWERLAYVSASLADLYEQNNQGEAQRNQNMAYTIYKKIQTHFYEELIVLLNNSALRKEKSKKFNEAIERYKEIVEIQKKYYSINDERKFITLNNLACAYCENQDKQQGMEIFNSLKEGIKNFENNDIIQLIQDNQNYYKKNNS